MIYPAVLRTASASVVFEAIGWVLPLPMVWMREVGTPE